MNGWMDDDNDGDDDERKKSKKQSVSQMLDQVMTVNSVQESSKSELSSGVDVCSKFIKF